MTSSVHFAFQSLTYVLSHCEGVLANSGRAGGLMKTKGSQIKVGVQPLPIDPAMVHITVKIASMRMHKDNMITCFIF